MNLKRIGLIRDTYFTNEPRGKNIAKGLVDSNYQVFVLCFGKINAEENHDDIIISRFRLNDKLKAKIYPFMNTIPLYKYIWTYQIKRFIKKYNPEILQVHDLYMLGPTFSACKGLNVKIVLNCHENYPAAVKNYPWAQQSILKFLTGINRWKKLEQKYLIKVDRMIVVCNEFKEKLLNEYAFLKSENIIVYPNVPSLNEFNSFKIDEKELIKKNNDFFIFYFGVLAKRRGIFNCLEALNILKDEINIKMIFIGPIDKKDKDIFFNMINEYKLNDRIIYHTWKDISFLPSYLSKVDICISPLESSEQHDTTYANKIFQYMLFKKVVLLSDVLPQKNIIDAYQCGLTHKANDSNDLAMKISQLYHHRDNYEKYANNGYRAVIEKFNAEICLKDVINMYNNL